MQVSPAILPLHLCQKDVWLDVAGLRDLWLLEVQRPSRVMRCLNSSSDSPHLAASRRISPQLALCGSCSVESVSSTLYLSPLMLQAAAWSKLTQGSYFLLLLLCCMRVSKVLGSWKPVDSLTTLQVLLRHCPGLSVGEACESYTTHSKNTLARKRLKTS